MSDWRVVAENGNERPVDSRSEAEEVKEEMEQLGMTVEIDPPKESDGGTDSMPEEPIDVQEAMDAPPQEESPQTQSSGSNELPDQPPLDEDPITWVPGDFTDTIQGEEVINRRGYEVIAQHFGIGTPEPECVVGPEETDFEYARVRATAETKDGRTYTAHGSAHIDRADGDDPTLLLELAGTRARKRALAQATGTGMLAVEELKNEL